MDFPTLRKIMKRKLGGLHASPSMYVLIAVYALLTVLILGPVFAPGFVLQYDMLFAPQIFLNVESAQTGANLYHNVALTAVLKLVSFILPVDVIQKIILAAIFFVGAYGMYRVVPVSSMAARLLAGAMYVANPFVYDRLMAGHWRFLLAYSLTPFIVMAFFKLYTSPSRKYVLAAILWWTAAVLVSAHHLIILGLLFVVLGGIFVRSWRELFFAAIVPLGVLLLNIWWLLPAGSSANFTESFGLDHFYAFATTTDSIHGLWFNMLSLQGFWHAGWQSVKDIFAFWPVLVLLWLVPVFVGLSGWRMYAREHKKLLLGLFLAAFIGLILAAGPHPAVWQLNSWIFTHVPGMSGMRESQKFLALLALAYAFVAAFGVNFLMKQHKKSALAVAAFGVVTIILLAWPMFWGAHGQMQPMHYPHSWYQFNKTLQADENAKVLILPWSVYTSDTFVDTLVANPARVYFGDTAVVSQRMNLSNVTDWTTPEQRKIEAALTAKDASLLTQAMQEQGIHYIAVTDPKQQKRYEWLLSSDDFSVTISNKNLIVILLTFR